MSDLDPIGESSRDDWISTVLLGLAVLLVPVGVGGMAYEMIGSSHNDWILEWPWFFGAATLAVAAGLSLASIVYVAPRRPWWIVIAYLLCVVAGCVGLWGLSVPLLD